jgi:hypothetical protein
VRRALYLTLALFQALWLNVVVPGHTRGIVPLPGPTRFSTDCALCNACPMTMNAPVAPEYPSKHHAPARSGGCAICLFAAHLTIPPPTDWSHGPLLFVARVRNQVASPRLARGVELWIDGRAPPAIV